MNALRWWLQRRRLRSIELLVLDVDGVLTDGGLWFDAEGQLSKRFDVRDGLGTVSYTHLRAHETGRNLVCRLLLEKKKMF